MKLKVATVQMTTDDRDKARVVDKVVRMIDEAGAQGADLIVLPEVWTGLGYADAYPFEAMAEPIPGPTTDTLTALARRHGAMIVGSMYERAADGRHFNTAPFINRDGSILGCYRKTHLFDAQNRVASGQYGQEPVSGVGFVGRGCVVDPWGANEAFAAGAHRHHTAQDLPAAHPTPKDDGTGEPIPHRLPPLERAGLMMPVTSDA
jgi:predicted amidohydrolase